MKNGYLSVKSDEDISSISVHSSDADSQIRLRFFEPLSTRGDVILWGHQAWFLLAVDLWLLPVQARRWSVIQRRGCG